MMVPKIRLAISSALIAHDKRQERRPHHNIYALSHYLGALEQAEKDMKGGATLDEAIEDNFLGSLRACVQRAVKKVSEKSEK